jgi:hypothetical protein
MNHVIARIARFESLKIPTQRLVPECQKLIVPSLAPVTSSELCAPVSHDSGPCAETPPRDDTPPGFALPAAEAPRGELRKRKERCGVERARPGTASALTASAADLTVGPACPEH